MFGFSAHCCGSGDEFRREEAIRSLVGTPELDIRIVSVVSQQAGWSRGAPASRPGRLAWRAFPAGRRKSPFGRAAPSGASFDAPPPPGENRILSARLP